MTIISLSDDHGFKARVGSQLPYYGQDQTVLDIERNGQTQTVVFIETREQAVALRNVLNARLEEPIPTQCTVRGEYTDAAGLVHPDGECVYKEAHNGSHAFSHPKKVAPIVEREPVESAA